MGGELAFRVASRLEADPRVEALAGVDFDPPRRRLRRTEFHLADPVERSRIVSLVREFAPTHMVHLGVYEPDARSTPPMAARRTEVGTLAALGAACETGVLERIVVRSGIEIYGRRRGAPSVPDEDVPPDPTSDFGRTLLDMERVAAAAAREADVTLLTLRFAPVVGPHMPSPLARLLRLPVVPFEALADPTFSMVDPDDAASAFAAAVFANGHGPVNVVGPGAVSATQAARLGGRIPMPTTGFGWSVYSRVAEVLGAPIPPHVRELLTRGRSADGGRTHELLGVAPSRSAVEIVKAVFEWAPVLPLRGAVEDAA
jgi:UDP-glucose 4-epimerase